MSTENIFWKEEELMVGEFLEYLCSILGEIRRSPT